MSICQLLNSLSFCDNWPIYFELRQGFVSILVYFNAIEVSKEKLKYHKKWKKFVNHLDYFLAFKVLRRHQICWFHKAVLLEKWKRLQILKICGILLLKNVNLIERLFLTLCNMVGDEPISGTVKICKLFIFKTFF